MAKTTRARTGQEVGGLGRWGSFGPWKRGWSLFDWQWKAHSVTAVGEMVGCGLKVKTRGDGVPPGQKCDDSGDGAK